MSAADGLNAAIGIAAMVVLWALYRAHQSDENKLNLMQYFTDAARPDRFSPRVSSFTVVAITATWGFVWMMVAGKMTETLFGLYLGLPSAAYIAGKQIDSKAGESQ